MARKTFVARRRRCGECGELVPSDSGLACKVVVTTGDGRTLLGRLKQSAGGRLLAAPQVFCTCCVVPALLREVEAYEWLRRIQSDPIYFLEPKHEEGCDGSAPA